MIRTLQQEPIEASKLDSCESCDIKYNSCALRGKKKHEKAMCPPKALRQAREGAPPIRTHCLTWGTSVRSKWRRPERFNWPTSACSRSRSLSRQVRFKVPASAANCRSELPSQKAPFRSGTLMSCAKGARARARCVGCLALAVVFWIPVELSELET